MWMGEVAPGWFLFINSLLIQLDFYNHGTHWLDTHTHTHVLQSIYHLCIYLSIYLKASNQNVLSREQIAVSEDVGKLDPEVGGGQDDWHRLRYYQNRESKADCGEIKEGWVEPGHRGHVDPVRSLDFILVAMGSHLFEEVK